MTNIVQKIECKACEAGKAILRFMATRLSQPSTWVSIATMLGMVHINIDAGLWSHIVEIGMGMSAVAGFVLNERGVKVMKGQQDIDSAQKSPNSDQG